jgi:hypothetical protein
MVKDPGASSLQHGVRAHAQALMRLELGRESELERLQRLSAEIEQEPSIRLELTLMVRAKDGILVVTSAGDLVAAHQTMQAGQHKMLERLGLTEERRPRVWALDAGRRPSSGNSAIAAFRRTDTAAIGDATQAKGRSHGDGCTISMRRPFAGDHLAQARALIFGSDLPQKSAQQLGTIQTSQSLCCVFSATLA